MAELIKSTDELLKDCDQYLKEAIELYNELIKDCNLEKDQPEKFFMILRIATSEENLENTKNNVQLLGEFQIKMKPSQWSVLTIDSELLKKALLRAKTLSFLEAYQQNAAFLKQDVDKIIKRIGELEAYGIPYKNEKGKYQSFLFSQRGFDYVISQSQERNSQIDKKESSEIDLSEIKKYADRVMETFSLTNEATSIYAKIENLANPELNAKDLLMEIFSGYSIDMEALNNCIDEILTSDEEIKMRRVA